MADVVPDLDTLAGDCASPRHCRTSTNCTDGCRATRHFQVARARLLRRLAARRQEPGQSGAALTPADPTQAKLLDSRSAGGKIKASGGRRIMSKAYTNPYEMGLNKNPANFVPLSPI